MEAAAAEEVRKVHELQSGALKIQERLQRRHQARTEDADRRKEAKESQTVAEEKGEYFSSAFNSERAAIEALLSGCSGSDRSAVNQKLEEATARTAQLQKFLNDSMMFLTSYDLRQAQAALQKLQSCLVETREEALPKKKFAFRSRTKAAEGVSSSAPGAPDDDAGGAAVDGAAVDGGATYKQCGFSDVAGASLTMTAEELRGRDVLLTHLSDCKVRLLGSPSTLHLKHIDNCEILCGPVSSSVFVDGCRGSTLGFPCQQLRTHNSADTRVYLHVTSRAIIEDCRGVSFAPLNWSYPGLERDFSVSGLDKDRNNWDQVDDFNWLAAGTPSPNWTVIPEADRKTSWDP